MNVLKKPESYTGRCLRRVRSAKNAFVALLVCFLASASFAATDYTALTSGVEGDIQGVGSVLMTLGAAIIGVVVVFLIVKFIRRMIGS